MRTGLGNIAIHKSSLVSNVAEGNGGALRSELDLHLKGTKLKGNRAAGDGGAVDFAQVDCAGPRAARRSPRAGSPATAPAERAARSPRRLRRGQRRQSFLGENRATGPGGAISGGAYLFESTIARNTSSPTAAASPLGRRPPPQISVDRSTISGDGAGSGGGIGTFYEGPRSRPRRPSPACRCRTRPSPTTAPTATAAASAPSATPPSTSTSSPSPATSPTRPARRLPGPRTGRGPVPGGRQRDQRAEHDRRAQHPRRRQPARPGLLHVRRGRLRLAGTQPARHHPGLPGLRRHRRPDRREAGAGQARRQRRPHEDDRAEEGLEGDRQRGPVAKPPGHGEACHHDQRGVKRDKKPDIGAYERVAKKR